MANQKVIWNKSNWPTDIIHDFNSGAKSYSIVLDPSQLANHDRTGPGEHSMVDRDDVWSESDSNFQWQAFVAVNGLAVYSRFKENKGDHWEGIYGSSYPYPFTLSAPGTYYMRAVVNHSPDVSPGYDPTFGDDELRYWSIYQKAIAKVAINGKDASDGQNFTDVEPNRVITLSKTGSLGGPSSWSILIFNGSVYVPAIASPSGPTTSVSGVSSAVSPNPIVITTNTSHSLSSGDQVTINGVVGNDAANGVFYVNILTTTTFELFVDVDLLSSVSGTGTYVSGGVVSKIIAGGDYTLVSGTLPLDNAIQVRFDKYITTSKTFRITNGVVGSYSTTTGPNNSSIKINFETVVTKHKITTADTLTFPTIITIVNPTSSYDNTIVSSNPIRGVESFKIVVDSTLDLTGAKWTRKITDKDLEDNTTTVIDADPEPGEELSLEAWKEEMLSRANISCQLKKDGKVIETRNGFGPFAFTLTKGNYEVGFVTTKLNLFTVETGDITFSDSFGSEGLGTVVFGG